MSDALDASLVLGILGVITFAFMEGTLRQRWFLIPLAMVLPLLARLFTMAVLG